MQCEHYAPYLYDPAGRQLVLPHGDTHMHVSPIYHLQEVPSDGMGSMFAIKTDYEIADNQQGVEQAIAPDSPEDDLPIFRATRPDLDTWCGFCKSSQTSGCWRRGWQLTDNPPTFINLCNKCGLRYKHNRLYNSNDVGSTPSPGPSVNIPMTKPDPLSSCDTNEHVPVVVVGTPPRGAPPVSPSATAAAASRPKQQKMRKLSEHLDYAASALLQLQGASHDAADASTDQAMSHEHPGNASSPHPCTNDKAAAAAPAAATTGAAPAPSGAAAGAAAVVPVTAAKRKRNKADHEKSGTAVPIHPGTSPQAAGAAATTSRRAVDKADASAHNTVNVAELWSVSQVEAWLRSIGCQEYIAPFASQDVDGLALRGLYRVGVNMEVMHAVLRDEFPDAHLGQRLRLIDGICDLFQSSNVP